MSEWWKCGGMCRINVFSARVIKIRGGNWEMSNFGFWSFWSASGYVLVEAVRSVDYVRGTPKEMVIYILF